MRSFNCLFISGISTRVRLLRQRLQRPAVLDQMLPLRPTTHLTAPVDVKGSKICAFSIFRNTHKRGDPFQMLLMVRISWLVMRGHFLAHWAIQLWQLFQINCTYLLALRAIWTMLNFDLKITNKRKRLNLHDKSSF